MADLLAELPPGATVPSSIAFPTAIAKDAKPEDRPDAERAALRRMKSTWELPEIFAGGTKAVREAGEAVLVKEQDETEDEFKRRMSRAFLTNFYTETISKHSAKPFGKEIVLEPALPERIAYLESDADGAKRSLSVFARDLLRSGMDRGLAHVLVDVPPGSGDTYADQLRRRPRLSLIDASCLLGVSTAAGKDGQEVVSYVRMRQSFVEKVGTFGEKPREVILQIAAGEASAKYAMNSDGSWQVVEAPVPYTSDEIPLFTFYANQTGEFEAEPPYLPLAELNLAHFQSDADQRHALSYGRRSTLIQTGWKDNNSPAEAVAKGHVGQRKRNALGYNRRLHNAAADAKAYFLETSGAPLEAGRLDLKALEERMERFGAAQVSKGGGITATSRRLDNKGDSCNLEAWCTRIEVVLLDCLRAAARLVGVELPKDQKVRIDRSFADDTPDSEDVPHIIAMARDSLLSRRSMIEELRSRGTLRVVKDGDEELASIAEESETMGNASLERLAGSIMAARPAPDAPEEPEEADTPEDVPEEVG